MITRRLFTVAPVSPSRSATGRLWLVAGLALGSVGIALVSQYGFDMRPCPWCILQRLIFLVVAAVAILAAWVTAKVARMLLAAVAELLCTAGAVAALYQHFVASRLNSCDLTLADRILGALGAEQWWPWLLQVQASCADAAVDLLGVPYEFWSLGLFIILGLLLASVVIDTARRR